MFPIKAERMCEDTAHNNSSLHQANLICRLPRPLDCLDSKKRFIHIADNCLPLRGIFFMSQAG